MVRFGQHATKWQVGSLIFPEQALIANSLLSLLVLSDLLTAQPRCRVALDQWGPLLARKKAHDVIAAAIASQQIHFTVKF